MFIAWIADSRHNLIEVDEEELENEYPLFKHPEKHTAEVIQINLIPGQTNGEKNKIEIKKWRTHQMLSVLV